MVFPLTASAFLSAGAGLRPEEETPGGPRRRLERRRTERPLVED